MNWIYFPAHLRVSEVEFFLHLNILTFKHSKNSGLSKGLKEARYHAFPQTIPVVKGKPGLACALFFVCVFAVYD